RVSSGAAIALIQILKAQLNVNQQTPFNFYSPITALAFLFPLLTKNPTHLGRTANCSQARPSSEEAPGAYIST
ncbi:MAG TPA: hypothetical protein VFM46_02085, partial [Pseudomonadales bacterium]|nr:hypothetical protein [Pseudomonadales bacterium]